MSRISALTFVASAPFHACLPLATGILGASGWVSPCQLSACGLPSLQQMFPQVCVKLVTGEGKVETVGVSGSRAPHAVWQPPSLYYLAA